MKFTTREMLLTVALLSALIGCLVTHLNSAQSRADAKAYRKLSEQLAEELGDAHPAATIDIQVTVEGRGTRVETMRIGKSTP